MGAAFLLCDREQHLEFWTWGSSILALFLYLLKGLFLFKWNRNLTQKCYFSLIHELFPWAQLWQRKISSNTLTEINFKLESHECSFVTLYFNISSQFGLQCGVQSPFRHLCSLSVSSKTLELRRAGSDILPAVDTTHNRHGFSSAPWKYPELILLVS